MSSKASGRFETFLIIFFFSTSLIILLFATGVFHIKSPQGPPIKYGFLNKQGSLEIGLEFDSVGDFHHGLATVKKNGQVFVINRQGEKTDSKPFRYQIDSLPIHHLMETHSAVESAQLDQPYVPVAPAQYGKALYRILRKKYCSDKESHCTFDFSYAFIDVQNGTKALQFEEAFPYSDSVALVHAEYGKVWRQISYSRNWAFINTEGQYICRPIYIDAHSFSEGLAAVAIRMTPHKI